MIEEVIAHAKAEVVEYVPDATPLSVLSPPLFVSPLQRSPVVFN